MENLNAEQIIKALECCASEVTKDLNCSSCPMHGRTNCMTLLYVNALSLIKELTEENKKIGIENFNLVCELSRIKENTVRKMQERLKEKAISVPTVYNSHFGRMIDQVAKELLEGNENEQS